MTDFDRKWLLDSSQMMFIDVNVALPINIQMNKRTKVGSCQVIATKDTNRGSYTEVSGAWQVI